MKNQENILSSYLPHEPRLGLTVSVFSSENALGFMIKQKSANASTHNRDKRETAPIKCGSCIGCKFYDWWNAICIINEHTAKVSNGVTIGPGCKKIPSSLAECLTAHIVYCFMLLINWPRRFSPKSLGFFCLLSSSFFFCKKRTKKTFNY